MAAHEELIGELPKLDKLSNAARLKAAKRRRIKQLKKYQEWVRLERASSSGASFMKKRGPARVVLEDGAMLSDMVGRNDIIGGESAARLWCDGGGADPLPEEWLFEPLQEALHAQSGAKWVWSPTVDVLASDYCKPGSVRYSNSVATVHSILEGGWRAPSLHSLKPFSYSITKHHILLYSLSC